MAQVGQTTPSGGRITGIYTQQAVARQVTVPVPFTANHIGVYCKEQTAANQNNLKGALYAVTGTALQAQTDEVTTPIESASTFSWEVLPFSGSTVYPAGDYVIMAAAGPGSNGVVQVNGQDGTAGTPTSMFIDPEFYPDFPDNYTGHVDTGATRAWDLYLDYTEASGSTGVEITAISDATLTHGQTGVTITGTGFSASGNEVIVSPTDNIDDPAAVAQTVTAESTTSITFTAVLSAFAFTTLYVFVRNADDESNTDGEPIARIVASATWNERFIGKSGEPVQTDEITFFIWRSPRPTGAPDEIFTSQATNANGEFSLSLALGSLQAGDPIFFLAFTPPGEDCFSAGVFVPDYA